MLFDGPGANGMVYVSRRDIARGPATALINGRLKIAKDPPPGPPPRCRESPTAAHESTEIRPGEGQVEQGVRIAGQASVKLA